MKGNKLKLKEIEASHTLGGAKVVSKGEKAGKWRECRRFC